jgi:Ser/Thr protein kinase RdoA (MazF antagonist)
VTRAGGHPSPGARPSLDDARVLSLRVAAEILGWFALGESPVLAGAASRGEQGQVWRLETSTGTWAVKELLQRESEADVQRSAEFQEVAVRAGVPAPAVVRTADRQVLLDVKGRQFRVFSWADILPPDPDVDPGKVGVLVAAIHRLGHPSNGRAHPWYTEPVGAARWHELFRQLIAAGNPLGERLADLHDELCGLEQVLDEPSRLQQLHLDLWADNVRATTGGDLCVIDWDNCGPGDARQELAAVLFEYCSGRPARTRALYDAYVDAGGPGRITRPEDFSMAIAQLGHILERQCANWLTATSAEERRHAEAAIDEFVSRPLTRPVIDEILAAVA